MSERPVTFTSLVLLSPPYYLLVLFQTNMGPKFKSSAHEAPESDKTSKVTQYTFTYAIVCIVCQNMHGATKSAINKRYLAPIQTSSTGGFTAWPIKAAAPTGTLKSLSAKVVLMNVLVFQHSLNKNGLKIILLPLNEA